MSGGELTRRLFDDAAIFPPGNTPMSDAVEGHLSQLSGPLSPMVRSFVVSATRVGEMATAIARHGLLQAVDVSVVAGTPADVAPLLARLPGYRDLALYAVEVRVDAEEPVAWLSRLVESAGAGLAVECRAADPRFLQILRAARRHRAQIKLRTGGTTPAAFPSAVDLARAVHACVSAGVPFKCTAGLHHAVRHSDPRTGFEHHGFLNVLLAAASADRLDIVELVDVLETTDRATVVAGIQQLGRDGVAAARDRFTSFGTCSLSDPVEDLLALEMLDVRVEVGS